LEEGIELENKMKAASFNVFRQHEWKNNLVPQVGMKFAGISVIPRIPFSNFFFLKAKKKRGITFSPT
jgi:hypothetical protein